MLAFQFSACVAVVAVEVARAASYDEIELSVLSTKTFSTLLLRFFTL